MEKVMVLIIGLFFSIGTLNAKQSSWEISKANLKYVFVPSKSNANTELIRLYQDKTFEHLIYVPVRSYQKGKEDFSLVHESIVQRNTGTYTMAAGKIQFSKITSEFKSDLYKKACAFIDNKVYLSRFQSIFQQKNFLFKAVNKNKYNSPFYLDPFSQRIVRNEGVETKIDLDDLAKKITKGGHSEWVNYQTLVNFIKKQIEIDSESSFDLFEETTDAAIIENFAGKERRLNSLQLSEVIEKMGKAAGLSITSIRGYLKHGEGQKFERRVHAWNKVELNESSFFSDVSMPESWLKVAPAVMIYSHLPLKAEDQLLEKPVGSSEFDNLAYVEQLKGGVSYVSFLPSKQLLVANGKVDILFEQQITGLRATFSAYDDINKSYGNSIPLNNSVTAQIAGTTKVSIPIKEKKGKLTLQLANGMVINYFIENNGKEETEVADYFKKIGQQKRIIPKVDVSNNSKSLKEIALTTNEFWENSSDLFLKELASYDFSDASLLQIPLIKEARKYYGIREIKGEQHNKTILNFFKETGNGSMKTDESAWCSVFVGYCAKQAGLNYSKKATAKSWLEQGIATTNPKPGDIVVFWRENPTSWKGHIAIYLGKDDSTNEIICLGGNQDGQVCIRQYGASHAMGYRRLIANEVK